MEPHIFNHAISSFSLHGCDLAVGVSGGADSLALILLLQEWGKARRLVAVTVDHQLRPESAEETEQVKSWMTTRNIGHVTLIWKHENVLSRIQERARYARYQLIGDWCIQEKIPFLLMAHHLEDQWETFFLRLKKGSGLRGLGGMRTRVHSSFGEVIRPLLYISQNDVRDTLKRFNQPFLHDPSNDNTAYERVKFRQDRASLLKNFGFTPESIILTMTSLQEAQDLIDAQVENLWKKVVADSSFDIDAIRYHPPLLVREFLTRIIRKTAQTYRPLRRRTLDHLYHHLISERKSFTGGGVIFIRKKNMMMFMKENRHPSKNN